MFGDFEAKQKEIKNQMASSLVEVNDSEGIVTIRGNAQPEITNIVINPSFQVNENLEQLEDLLLVLTNEFIKKAQIKQAAITQQMLSTMLPGGLGGLTDMLKPG